MIPKTAIGILTTQVIIASGGLDLENPVLDGQKRQIENPSTKIEDEDVTLVYDFLVETISDSGCSWFVDDAKDIPEIVLASLVA